VPTENLSNCRRKPHTQKVEESSKRSPTYSRPCTSAAVECSLAGRIIKLLNTWTLCERTVRQTIHRWQTQGLVGLFDRLRSGRKQRWQEADIAYLEEGLQQEQRTYNVDNWPKNYSAITKSN
jgi:DNA-binding transcriptional regulator PaaX